MTNSTLNSLWQEYSWSSTRFLICSSSFSLRCFWPSSASCQLQLLLCSLLGAMYRRGAYVRIRVGRSPEVDSGVVFDYVGGDLYAICDTSSFWCNQTSPYSCETKSSARGTTTSLLPYFGSIRLYSTLSSYSELYTFGWLLTAAVVIPLLEESRIFLSFVVILFLSTLLVFVDPISNHLSIFIISFQSGESTSRSRLSCL